MTTEQRCMMIAEKRKRMDEAMLRKQQDKESMIFQYKKRIRETYSKRINDMIKVAYELCANGYQLGESAGWFNKPYFLCCCSRNNFAFVPDVQFMPKKIIGVGTLGFFIDANGGFHEERDCNVEYAVSHFEERFEKLEKEFYDYVDSL